MQQFLCESFLKTAFLYCHKMRLVEVLSPVFVIAYNTHYFYIKNYFMCISVLLTSMMISGPLELGL